ncbi:MAG: hypothetical protein AB1403_13490 [Candidatus Riflebacteria bacterium]
MIINRANSGLSVLSDRNSFLADPLANEPGKIREKERENTEERNSAIKAQKPALSDMQKLSPVDQYRYVDGQSVMQPQPVNLRVVPGNPEKTLTMANQVINDAIMPPVFSNPNRVWLTEAMQIKRMAETQIDLAA